MKHIVKSSLIVATFFAVDKVLGFVRQLFVARQFSLTYQMDVFNAANNIPDLLSALISGGALGIALIPVLSEYLKTKTRAETWKLFSQVLNLAFLVTAVFALLIAIFAPWLVRHVIAPGFPEEQKILTISLMRLDLVAIIIFSISGLVMAGLQANQHFLLPAMAPGLYNIGQIFGAAVLAPAKGYTFGPVELPGMGLGIYGLVYGVIIGALLHLLIQVPGLIRYKFRWTPALQLRDPGMTKVLSLLGPRVLTMFFLQIFFIARDNLASHLGEGAITAINLGWFIMQVPETLLGTAIAVALLPTISELFAQGKKEAFSQTINAAIKVMLALTIPSAALLSVGLTPLVRAAFNFDEAGTMLIVQASRAYLLGLVGHSLLEIAARSYYAQQNAKTPLFAAAINAGVYLAAAALFSRVLGGVGIALAITFAFTGEALLLLWLLRRTYPDILKANQTIIRISLGTLIASTLLFLAMRFIGSSIVIALGGMVVGLTMVVPFIFPELRLLFRLDKD